MGISKRKKIIAASTAIALILLASAFVLNSKFHIFADIDSSISGNYDTTKYAVDATTFYGSIKSALSPQITITNSMLYRNLRSDSPAAIAQIGQNTADGFMGENEISPAVEKQYETPDYVLGRYKINNDLCQLGKSALMDAHPDYSGGDANIKRNMNYTLSMYYLSASDCSFLSWRWFKWHLPIARDIGDSTSDPTVLDSQHEVFKREYSNALILVRPDYSGNTETADYTYTLPTTSVFYVLNSNNTLSADPVTEVTIPRHQGIILIKDPGFNRTPAQASSAPANCVLCLAVNNSVNQTNGHHGRLFPHIYTYASIYNQDVDWYNPSSPKYDDKLDPYNLTNLNAAKDRFDITSNGGGAQPPSNYPRTDIYISYINWSDKLESSYFSQLAKFYLDKGKSFDNAFVYYAKNISVPTVVSNSVLDQLENMFPQVIQNKGSQISDITLEAFGNKETRTSATSTEPAKPVDPIHYGIQACPASGDSINIGNYWKYGQINLNIIVPKAADETINIKYYDQNSSWQTLPLSSDTTNRFAQKGELDFDPPASWKQTAINDESLYWVKIECQNVPKSGGSLKFESVANLWSGFKWDGTSAISGEKYPVVNGTTIIPGWDEQNDTNKDGIINNGETLDPQASAKFRYMSRAQSTYRGNRWVMNLGDSTYAKFAIDQSKAAVNGYDGTFIDNVYNWIPDLGPILQGMRDYFDPSPAPTETISLKKGYNTVDSKEHLDAQSFIAKGLTVFAFNQAGDKAWDISNLSKFSFSKIKPGLGYYIYSPFDQTVSASIVPLGSGDDDFTVIRQGWNLLSNSSDQPKKLSDFTYPTIKAGQDNTCPTSNGACFESKKLSELFDPSSSRAYHKYVIIKDGGATDPNAAFEYVDVNQDNLNTLAIAPHKTFWFYLYK